MCASRAHERTSGGYVRGMRMKVNLIYSLLFRLRRFRHSLPHDANLIGCSVAQYISFNVNAQRN